MNQTRFVQKILGIATLFLMTAVTTWAGVSTSGGGYAIVTRDASGKIQKAELLDLYEARENLGFSLQPSTGSIEQDYLISLQNTMRLQWWLTRLKPITHDDSQFYQNRLQLYAGNVKKFLEITRFTQPSEKLPYQNDIGSVVSLPEGAHLEQLAVYNDDTNTVDVDNEIWMNLDSLSQAALIDHEIFYRSHRKYGKRINSRLARLWVAHTFANQSVPAVDDGVPKDAAFCKDKRNFGDNYFYLYTQKDPQTVKSNTVLQFMHLAGNTIPTKATVEIPNDLLFGKGLRFAVQSTFNMGWEVELTQISDIDFNLSVYEEGRLISSYPVSCRH